MILSNSSRSIDKLYVDDIFSIYPYTGNGSSQTITNGINLADNGGMVWVKATENTNVHNIWDSARGLSSYLDTTSTGLQSAQGSTSFTSSGFSFGTGGAINNNSNVNYTSYSFRKANNFFDTTTKSHTTGSNSTVSLTSMSSIGMVVVKRYDSSGSWYVWHRSLTSGYNILMETANAQFNTNAYISVSGNTITIASGMPTGSYVIYAFAHDTSTDGIIQCDSYTGLGNIKSTLGWEPQYLLVKRIDGVTDADWIIYDNMIGGLSNSTRNDMCLYSNSANAVTYNNKIASLNPDGVTFSNPNNFTYIYVAIRRNNKPPTSSSQVFSTLIRAGNGAKTNVSSIGFSPDIIISSVRSTGAVHIFDKLRSGSSFLYTYTTLAEANGISSNATIDYKGDGITVGADTAGYINYSTYPYSYNLIRRAPGFMDIINYTGTSSNLAITHQLKVTPGLIFIKSRASGDWVVFSSTLNNTQYLVLNSTAIPVTDSTMFNSTSPTTTQFTVGTNANVNDLSTTYTAYMFATKAEISKVGTYTGNGSSQTINCNFTSGARFIMIKRTDSTGGWYFWDAARGIVSANDPHLSLNTFAAEVTTDDSVDPDNTGFIVNQNTATNINVNNATYLYLAIA